MLRALPFSALLALWLCAAVARAQMTCTVASVMGCYTDFTYPPSAPQRVLAYGPLTPLDASGLEKGNSLEVLHARRARVAPRATAHRHLT
jgi:hypothetical protein